MSLSKLSFVAVGGACAILSASSPGGARSGPIPIATGPNPPALARSGPLSIATDENPPAVARSGPLTIRTGFNAAVDGYLRVTPDAYGAWADVGFGGLGDTYNPAGVQPASQMAFTAGFWLFVPLLGQQELLADNVTWQGVGGIGGDLTLIRVVTSPNSASDTDGDGANDRMDSSFDVLGAGTDLSFDLIQHVSNTGDVTFLRQIYTVTNNSIVPSSFIMVRVFDGDLLWSGGAENDEVGTTTNGAGLGPYVYMQEASDPAVTAITISGERLSQGRFYFGGKRGVVPGLGPPAYDFGTDTEILDAGGIPTSWENHIAGVGYNTNGDSGIFPVGALIPADALIGLDFSVVNLALGASTTILMVHTFGQNTPHDPCPWDCGIIDNEVSVPDLLRLLGDWGGASDCDVDGSGVVNVPDLLAMLAQWGDCP